MTEGWQAVCYGGAAVLFVLALLVDLVKRPGWPALIAAGFVLLTLVPLWNAASAA